MRPVRGVLEGDRRQERSGRGGRRFTAFFQGAYPGIVGQLRLLTGDLASAKDIAQEAFPRAAARWPQLARYDQPQAWVRKTAFRLAVDLLRRAVRQQRLLARLGSQRGPDPKLTPQDQAVVEAMQRLPLPLQKVLVLHHCLDLPVETVAAQTRVSVGTVKSRLSGVGSGWPTCWHPAHPQPCPRGRPNRRRSGMPGRDLPRPRGAAASAAGGPGLRGPGRAGRADRPRGPPPRLWPPGSPGRS